MKKKNPSEQAPAQFRNNAFQTLKGLPSSVVKPALKQSPAPRTVKKENPEDEAALFQQAVEGVRGIHSFHEPVAHEQKINTPVKPALIPREDDQLFLQAMQKIGTTFRDEMPDQENEEPAPRSSSSRMRQMKRGTLHISGELDLHGLIRDEALVKLSNFIGAAFRQEQQAVLVITGKGNNSAEGPVLQGAVADWLRSKGKGMVAEFAPAPRDKGGSGAYVVFLKV